MPLKAPPATPRGRAVIRSLDDAIRFARLTEGAAIPVYVADWSALAAFFDAEGLWQEERLAAWLAATPAPAPILAELVTLVYATPALLASAGVADLGTLTAAHREAVRRLGPRLAAGFLDSFRRGAPQTPFETPSHVAGHLVRPVWLHPPRREVPFSVTLLSDLDEGSAVQSELWRTGARYRAIVEDQTDFVVRYRPDGVRTFVNAAYADFFGGRREDFEGSSFFDLIAPEHRPAVEEKLRRLAAREVDVLSDDHLSRRHDGALRWTHWIDRAIFDDHGTLLELQAVGRDVTERKEAEERRLALERRLAQAQKMEAVGALAGGMAHDFNNTLAAILAYAEMIRMAPADSARVERFSQGIVDAAGQGSALIRSLLQVGRRLPAELAACDLGAVVEAAGRLLASALPSRLRLTVEVAPLPRLRADAAQLTQAILNLGLNARDAIAGPGTIRLAAALERGEGGEEAVVRVSDDGAGIPAEVLPRVFEPFFTTKPEGRGSGLGLAMVYACAEAHHGRVEVESTLGRGTTVTLRFPLVRARQPRTRKASSAASASGGAKT